jgi:hypothetical protein
MALDPVLSGSLADGTIPSQHPSDGPSERVGALATTIINFVASPTRAYVNDTITFYVNASSDVGTSLNYTIFFDIQLADYTNNTASPSYSTTTGNPGNVVTTYAYDHVGNLTADGTYFRAKVYVNDGYDIRTAAILVYILENAPPEFTLNPAESYTISPNVEYSFTVSVMDVDDDPVTVTWDFGDGSDLEVDSTGPAATPVSFTRSHTWSPYLEPALENYYINYTMTIALSDDQDHTAQTITNLSIHITDNYAPTWSFWLNSTYSTSFADPFDVIWLYANATDDEGDPLTWTYMFSNETEVYHTEVHTTLATEPDTTVWQNVTHVFGAEGNFTVKLWLTDALLPELQEFPHNLSDDVSITCVFNVPPYALENITLPAVVYLDNVTEVARVEISVQAIDDDGDVLTITWNFGDGSSAAVNTSAGGRLVYTFYQYHEYSAAGIYYVSCNVTDGRAGHEIMRNGTLTIRSNNSAPEVRAVLMEMSNSNFALPNSAVNLTLVLRDAENDPVEISWDFGDGSPAVRSYVTEFASDGNGTSTVSHAYELPGTYTVQVWYTDHMFDTVWHNGSLNATVTVRTERVQTVMVWDWWDTTSLCLLIGSVASTFVYAGYVRKVRRKLDEKGMTLEEHKILVKERKDELKRARKEKALAAKRQRADNKKIRGGAK